MDKESNNTLMVTFVYEKEIETFAVHSDLLAAGSAGDSISSSGPSIPSSPSISCHDVCLADDTKEPDLQISKSPDGSLQAITWVSERLGHLIRENDILCKICGKDLKGLSEETIEDTIQSLPRRREPITLTFRRRESDDLLKEFQLLVNTRLNPREASNVVRTGGAKPKIIQVDCLDNQFTCPVKDKVIAKPINLEKMSSFFFYVWPFKCFILRNGKKTPHIGFTATCKIDGKKYDICSDLQRGASGYHLKLKPHRDVNLGRIDERFFLLKELESKQMVIGSLQYKDIFVAYSQHYKCLTMKKIKDVSEINVEAMFTMSRPQCENGASGASGPCAM